MINNYERDYNQVVQRTLYYGERRDTRAGDTFALFGQGLTITSLIDGYFPLLTKRPIAYKGVFGELAAFLRGATDLATYKKYGCNYWDANAKAWTGNLGVPEDKFQVGRIYGAQWRNWRGGHDQIKELIYNLKHNTGSRRHLLTTYDPAELGLGCLPPCHLLAQFHVTNTDRLDCMVTMRSVDLCLGLPSDVALYAALMLIICNDVGCLPGRLIFSLGDTHIYTNHEEPWMKHREQDIYELPRYSLACRSNLIDTFTPDDLVIVNYKHSPKVPYVFNV